MLIFFNPFPVHAVKIEMTAERCRCGSPGIPAHLVWEKYVFLSHVRLYEFEIRSLLMSILLICIISS